MADTDVDPLKNLGLPAVTWENLAYGLVAIAAAVLLGWVLRLRVSRVLLWRDRGESAAWVFGSLTGWAVTVPGIAVALTLVFPSVRPVDVLGGVGIVTLAAGIAFQTVLGKIFAGVVILARDLYRVGDQVEVDAHAGTITLIGLSATRVRSFDGRMMLVPNSTMRSEVVTVQTGSVDLELRFWSGSRQLETRAAQSNVIRAVLGELRRAGVPLASATVTVTSPGNDDGPSPLRR